MHLEPPLPRELQAVQGLWQVKSGLRVRIDRDQAGAAGGLFPHLPGEGLYTPFLAPCSCGLRTRSLYCQLRMLSTPGPEHMPGRMSECQTECQNIICARKNVKIDPRQNVRIDEIDCQNECMKRCQIECQNRCQIACQKDCQKECQNRYAIYYIYIQMVCQKLCQNSVSGWGSLEVH